ncbi:haloacid dehalogenase [Chlorobaculum sp. 24CR]|nr:HAD family hydrolase [Chlorobaculum sp. 24CR]RXK82362.1 haloacid dehalogenase [Chlorobaculum sp. 24CR]
MGVILLDIGNVLVNVDFMPFCRAVSRKGEAGAAAIMERYCQGELKDRHDTGRTGPQEYLSMIAADPLTRDLPPDRLRLAWQDIFVPTPGSAEAVETLRQRHRLWIMSDTDPLHFAFLIDRFPVLRNMDRYFLSYEHGWLKRSPEAFRYVLDSSGFDASGFLLIDDREVNTGTCAEAGIQSILFRSWKETLASPLLAAFSQCSAEEEART